MKKVFIFLAIVIALFIALAVLTNMKNKAPEDNLYGKKTLEPETMDLLDDENYQNIILPNELEQKLDNKEDVTVYFFASNCPYCRQATPILTPLANEMGIDLVQYNVLEFQEGWDDYKLQSTPTIIQFKDGKESARINGLQTEVAYKEWFTEHSLTE